MQDTVRRGRIPSRKSKIDPSEGVPIIRRTQQEDAPGDRSRSGPSSFLTPKLDFERTTVERIISLHYWTGETDLGVARRLEPTRPQEEEEGLLLPPLDCAAGSTLCPHVKTREEKYPGTTTYKGNPPCHHPKPVPWSAGRADSRIRVYSRNRVYDQIRVYGQIRVYDQVRVYSRGRAYGLGREGLLHVG